MAAEDPFCVQHLRRLCPWLARVDAKCRPDQGMWVLHGRHASSVGVWVTYTLPPHWAIELDASGPPVAGLLPADAPTRTLIARFDRDEEAVEYLVYLTNAYAANDTDPLSDDDTGEVCDMELT